MSIGKAGANAEMDTTRFSPLNEEEKEVSDSTLSSVALPTAPIPRQIDDQVSPEQMETVSGVSLGMFDRDVVDFRIDSAFMDSVPIANVSVAHSLYETNKTGIELPHVLHRSDGIFCLILFFFLIVAHVYNGGVNFVKTNMPLVFSSDKVKNIHVQGSNNEIIYSYFLVFLAVLMISISLYEGLERFAMLHEQSEKIPFIRISIFVVLISTFVFVKLLFNRFIGFVFDLGDKIMIWNKTYLVLFSILGLLSFLPTLMLVYSNWWHGVIIVFSLSLFLIVQMILITRLIVAFIRQRYSVLSLVAYLLTVEIIPYIYLGLGLLYFYQIDIFNTI